MMPHLCINPFDRIPLLLRELSMHETKIYQCAPHIGEARLCILLYFTGVYRGTSAFITVHPTR